MRIYEGYMTRSNRKAAFEVRASRKANALKSLRENNPGWRIVIVSSRPIKRRGR